MILKQSNKSLLVISSKDISLPAFIGSLIQSGVVFARVDSKGTKSCTAFDLPAVTVAALATGILDLTPTT